MQSERRRGKSCQARRSGGTGYTQTGKCACQPEGDRPAGAQTTDVPVKSQQQLLYVSVAAKLGAIFAARGGQAARG